MNNPFGPEIAKDVIENKIKDTPKIESINIEKLDMKIRIEKTGILPRNGGNWTGEPGNSHWIPEPNYEPGDRNGTNPEHSTWSKIMDEYGFKSIPFSDYQPDFSEVTKGEVKIDDFTDDRDANFFQADEIILGMNVRTAEPCKKYPQKFMVIFHILAVFLNISYKKHQYNRKASMI